MRRRCLADVNGASGGAAVRLDAAVMGTCPTFINQSWKKGNHVRGERRGGGGGVARDGGGGGASEGANKAHIDVLNTAAGVS